MSDVDPIFTVQEESLEVVRPGPNLWLLLGTVFAVIAVVWGWRRARAKKRRSRPAVPTAELPA